MEGVTGAASAEGGLYLGELYETVASDSQAALRRCTNLSSAAQPVRSWIDERVVKAAGLGAKDLMWVKSHNVTRGNEQADARAKRITIIGRLMSKPSMTTPAGIRQAYPLHTRTPQTKWDRDTLRGLMYLHTDRGPMEAWLHKIGRAPGPFCGCGLRTQLT
ncbi:hypothetical protein L211DRAFT_32240 [Terfezia boudieri ATCC MYA-4762]|uniref:Uncharacterized protein n=1 Tax=Terfezia boudieri ATCC MYA-4762 TaxID=1051890 RepID=A0A3N4MPT4_9PEZI|nr:hypothetical protein L211DRAFT_32240 [Terfezia boudieri ATCC MYA-4762]